MTNSWNKQDPFLYDGFPNERDGKYLKVSSKKKSLKKNDNIIYLNNEWKYSLSDIRPLVQKRTKHNLQEIDKKIHSILSNGYATIEYLATALQVSPEFIKIHLDNSKTKYRKSFIKSGKGNDLYMLKRKHSAIIDFWRAFCFMNYIIFSK